MTLEVGSTIGDYQIIGILGAGGMGKVYKVRNTISDRIEAMKVLLPDLANEPDLADRFLREIKVQASLEHPNIAALHTAVRVENQLLMLMEYVEGITLDQQHAEGPIPIPQAVDYIRQVLAALEYAHGRGVIHRDIKPANMMLTPEGVVKLMDFGIAKAATDRKLTMTGTTMGSLYYMSPEQIQGVAGLDARCDLYSMGVSLYELVTGKRPFDGDSQFAIMAAHLEKTPVPPIQLDPKMPQMLNDVILMSVLKDPNARFQTATAFRNALGNVAAGLVTAAPSRMPTVPLQTVPPAAIRSAPAVAPPPPPQPAAPARPRGMRGLWMGIGAIAAVAAVIAVLELGPFKHAKAGNEPNNPPGASQQAEQSTPAQATPAPTAPAPTTAPENAAASSTPTAPVSTPPQMAPAVTSSEPKQTRADAKAAVRQQASTQRGQTGAETPVTQYQTPVQPPQQTQAVQPPQQTQAQPAQMPPQQTPQTAPQQPAADNVAVRAQLAEVREQYTMLNVRANGIRNALQRLESQQAAGGLGMNASLTSPRDLMNSYMEEATNAMNAGDPATAKAMLKKAETQVERLEKLLNR